MKFSQILILSIFLLYSKYSYSLKCYNGGYGKLFDYQEGGQVSMECPARFCLLDEVTDSDNEVAVLNYCDYLNLCTKAEEIKQDLTVEEIIKSANISTEKTEKIPEELKNQKLHSRIVCCNTDNCNSAGNSGYSNLIREVDNKRKLGNNKDNSRSSSSYGPLFCFNGYIKILGAFFIATLYKF